jgi:hypothetical protein
MVLLRSPRVFGPHSPRLAPKFKELPFPPKLIPYARPLITPSSSADAFSILAKLFRPRSNLSKSADAHPVPERKARLLSAAMAPTPIQSSKPTRTTWLLPPEQQPIVPKRRQPEEPPPEVKPIPLQAISLPQSLPPLELLPT